MKIKKNAILGTWEMAEGDGSVSRIGETPAGLVPRDGTKMLVVDDDDFARRIYQRILQDAFPGQDLELVKDGLEGLEAFKKGHHGVIIMDLAMTKMDGLQSFKEIRKFCREQQWELPPVMFCTGYDPPQEVRDIVAHSVGHCMLRKPVGNSIIIDAVRSRLVSKPA